MVLFNRDLLHNDSFWFSSDVILALWTAMSVGLSVQQKYTGQKYEDIEHFISNQCALICCYKSLHFLGRFSTITEVGHGFWVIRPGLQSVFQFISMVFRGVKVRALCTPLMFFRIKLEKIISLWTFCFLQGGTVMLFQTDCCHKGVSMKDFV